MRLPTRHNASRRLTASMLVYLLGLGSVLQADEVLLAEGGKLSGNVLSILEHGEIEMRSPLSPDVITLKGNSIQQIDFEAAEPLETMGNARFELAGRDFIMGRLLGYTRESGARVLADGMGEIELPAGSLRSVALDMQPVRTLYRGPDELANWTTDGRRGGEQWEYSRDRLSAKGNGQIGRMIELPDQYVIRAAVSWQGHPNFQIGFSDPLEEPTVRVDRYYLQFGRAGLEIKREAKEGRRYHTVGMLNRTPEQFPKREMVIELRVDLRGSMIHLAIDGKPEGRFMDPFGHPPSAGGISLVNHAGPGQQLDVTELVVESWHETLIAEPNTRQRAVEASDSLLMRDGDRFGGELESVTETDDGMLFRMKVGFRDAPIEVLGDDIAQVTFGMAGERDRDADVATDLVLQLRDRGRLSVTRSEFVDGEVRAVHPLLGDLNLPRNAVSSLVRQKPDDAPDKR